LVGARGKGKWYRANQFLLLLVAEGTDMDQRYRLAGAANLATATGIAGRYLAGSSGRFWFAGLGGEGFS
jgi:hypothetical protein